MQTVTYYSPIALTNSICKHALFIHVTDRQASILGKTNLNCARQSLTVCTLLVINIDVPSNMLNTLSSAQFGKLLIMLNFASDVVIL